MDGWGISPSWGGNAIAVNSPQNMNRLWRDYPHKVLQAFTMVAGKYGVVGDSRLGHSTIAAGRRLPQELEVISEAINNNSFYRNKVLIAAIDHCKKYNSNLHLLGLLSMGGVHSYLSHLQALLEFCLRQNFDRVYIDAITDGIDSGQYDGLSFVEKINQKITETGLGKFSSLIGRVYAMDRVDDFNKTLKAFELLTEGKGKRATSITQAIAEAYRDDLNDFTISPTTITNNYKITPIKDNDAVIFFNFRADRSQQLSKMLLNDGARRMFWKPKVIKNLYFVTFIDYGGNLPAHVAFPKKNVPQTLGEVLAIRQEKQLRVAESEKEAHVTSFFNCGKDEPFIGEQRRIIPSRKTDDAAKDPEMQATKITQVVNSAIKSRAYDFILVNLANVDMISHTGNMMAAGRAIQSVDKAVGILTSENLKAGGATIITADHGNIEEMVKINPRQDPENKHTLNPVPFILVTPDNKKNLLKSAISSSYFSLSKIVTAKETLADIAPTIMELMEVPKPEEMTGHSLLNRLE